MPVEVAVLMLCPHRTPHRTAQTLNKLNKLFGGVGEGVLRVRRIIILLEEPWRRCESPEVPEETPLTNRTSCELLPRFPLLCER
eukprot:1538335-Amphidinium_carterae.1